MVQWKCIQRENQIKYVLIKEVNFTNRSMKSRLEKNDIEMYSAHNEGKSAVAQKCVRTLKT